MSESPFFHRRSVHDLIDLLSGLNNLTIFVGAGASFERTTLSWAGLIAEMLPPEFGTFSERRDLVDKFGPERAASVVQGVYQGIHPKNWRNRISDTLRGIVYRGDVSTVGVFTERIGKFVGEMLANERSIAIVTTNYESFIRDDIIGAVDGSDERNDNELPPTPASRVETFVFGMVDDDGLLAEKVPDRLRRLSSSIENRETATVVYMHGLLTTTPEDGDKDSHRIFPVLSELDYSATAGQSRNILETLFRDRNVLIVGASLTDPPLVAALLETIPEQPAQARRFVIQPLPSVRSKSGADNSSLEQLVRLHDARFAHLGVKAIRPDFFLQVPQILEEARFDLLVRSSHYVDVPYAHPQALHRYGIRLLDWWNDWLYQPSELAHRQKSHHKYLRRSLRKISQMIDSPGDEVLKLEIWIRWHPENSRVLALWASSVGTWEDVESMRMGTISSNSPYAAMRAFVAGAPQYHVSNEPDDRWRSFLARPIWFTPQELIDTPDQSAQDGATTASTGDDPLTAISGGAVPVGAICIASMRQQDQSSLNPQDRKNAAKLLVALGEAGLRLITPRY